MDERGGEKKDPIRVVDRRSFTADGKRRESESADERDSATPEPPPPDPRAAEPSPRGPVPGEGFTMETPPQGAAERGAAVEDAAFLNLLISLYNSGCIHLGLTEEEKGGTPAKEPDLDGARGVIELLGALKRKTTGNLSTDEARILESLIADLQMAYVMKASRA